MRYHSTQPWPYPSSLMIGLIAEVEDGEATADQTELEEVRWFTREEARALIGATLPGARAPGSMAIAHQLIKAWADAERAGSAEQRPDVARRQSTRQHQRAGD